MKKKGNAQCDKAIKNEFSLKRRMACKDHGRICIAFVVACVVGKNPKTSNLSPMADDAITRGDLGCPVYV